MYCIYCGKKLEDTWKICPYCGKDIRVNMNDKIEKEENLPKVETIENERHDPEEKYKLEEECKSEEQHESKEKCKSEEEHEMEEKYEPEERHKPEEEQADNISVISSYKRKSFWKYFGLSLITCGLYSIYFWHKYVQDINKICKNDGKESDDYFVVIFLSIITLGIYGLYWKYTQAERLYNAGKRYGVSIREKGSTVLIWTILGIITGSIGEFTAQYILIDNLNYIALRNNNTVAENIPNHPHLKRNAIIASIVYIVLVLFAVLGIFWAIISGIGEQEVSSETKIQTMEEVGGYQQWVEDGYPGKVRTDIVVDLPVSIKESSNDYCVHILTSFGDPIFIEQKDGSNADTWEWLNNASADIEGGNTATFKATLTFDGGFIVDDKAIPKFIAEDIESYNIGTDKQTMTEPENINNAEADYIFPNSDSEHLMKIQVQEVGLEKMRIGRNEIFARHGVIFHSEDLQNYFESKSWYQGTVSIDDFNAEAEFNEYEKANVALIKSVEDEMKGNSTQESFIGVSGTYTSGSAGDYGVIDVEVIDNEHINVAIGTGEALGYLGGVGGGMDGTIIDAYTAVVDWGAGLYFVLSWSDAGIMVVTREGSTDYDVLDAVTDNVEYVNIDYYPVS